MAGRRCSYGDAADRQRDGANGGLAAFPMLSAFLARARRPSSGGGGVVAGRVLGGATIDSAIARTGVLPRLQCFCVFSRARGGRHQVAAGSWPGLLGMLLIDSAIARTGVLPRSPCLCVSPRARRPSSGGGGVVAGRWCSYGEAADRQRDRANGGLALWVFLLWNFAGSWPLADSMKYGVEDNPSH